MTLTYLGIWLAVCIGLMVKLPILGGWLGAALFFGGIAFMIWKFAYNGGT